MAIYFDIIIPLEKLFKRITALKLNEQLDGYCGYFNIKTKDSNIKIDLSNYDASVFNHPDYSFFFLISKQANFKAEKSPYDDSFFPFTIEMTGGRETETEIEQLRFRRLAKQPDKETDKAFQKLQRSFNKDSNIGKGLHWGKHFYKRKYYEKNKKKIVWGNFKNRGVGPIPNNED